MGSTFNELTGLLVVIVLCAVILGYVVLRTVYGASEERAPPTDDRGNGQ